MSATARVPTAMRRVCVVAERMVGPLDEGGRKFAHNLTSALEAHATVLGVSVGGSAVSVSNRYVRVPASRYFRSGELQRIVRSFDPDTICYVPESSMTLGASIRAGALKAAAPNAMLALIALQPRFFPAPVRGLLRLLRPDVVLTLSRSTAQGFAALGCRTGVLPPAVDMHRFSPVDSGEKRRLRTRYGLVQDAFIVLHIGHAKRERGIALLAHLPKGMQGVMVAARSEGVDGALVHDLRARGVIIVDRYLSDIHELYQAADCYLFPVFEPDASIDLPLSVLEAMACNLPVVAAPFGALPEVFTEGPGFRFARTPAEMLDALSDRAWMTPSGTLTMAQGYSWDRLAIALLRTLEDSP